MKRAFIYQETTRMRKPFRAVFVGVFLLSTAFIIQGQTVDFIASSTAGCSGFTVTFTNLSEGFSGSETYLWDFGIGAVPATSSDKDPFPVLYTYNESDPTPTVTLTVTDGSTYTKTEVDYIIVSPSLPVSVSIVASSTTVCSGTTVDYTATGVNGGISSLYQWYVNSTAVGSNQATYSYVPSEGDQVMCELTSSETCATGSPSNSNTIGMTVNAPVTPSFIALGPYCEGATPGTLPVSSTELITGTWTPSVISTATAGTTVYSFTPDAGQCATSTTMTVVVTALPSVNAGADASILFGTNTTLTGSVTGEGPFTYLWTPSDRVLSPTNITTQTTNLNLSTVFTLTATSIATGCIASDVVTVTVTGDALSVSVQATDNLICSGESVQLSAIASGGSGTYTYSWTSDPSGFTSELLSPSVAPANTTTYYVTVNDGFNSAAGQTTIVVNPLPQAIAGPDRSIFQGQNTEIGAIANTGSTYSWTSNPIGFTSTEANPIVIPSVTTTYIVTETITSTGCSNINSVTVTVNSLPASFIPVWWPGNGVDHMNFYVSTATLDNDDLQPGDIIGVFDGNLCVGVGVLTEVLNGSNLLPVIVSRDDSFTPEIDGYTLGNVATYRIWDDGDNQEYYYTDASYISGNNIFAVGATTYLELNGVRPLTQTISLASGWNILSFTVSPDNRSMLSVVQPLIDNGTLVKVQNEAGVALEFLGSSWYNFIGNMAVTEGYKVRVNASTSLNITGRPVESPLNIPLSTGWNIISYPFMNSQPALDVFDPLIDAGTLVKVQNEAGVALEFLTGYGWLDNIRTILPGEGYKVRTNANTTLSLSDDMGAGLKNSYTIAQATYFKSAYTGNGLDHMNIYFLRSNLLDDGLISGDEIGVYDGDICIGYGILEDSEQRYISLIASFDDPATPQQDGFVEGHPINLKIWSQKTGRTMEVNRILSVEGYSKNFVKNGTSIITGSFATSGSTCLGEAYPNPSTFRTTFNFNLASNEYVRLEIINSLGVVIRTLINEVLPAGQHAFEWNNDVASGHRLKPGVYFYRLVTSDYTSTKSLMIVE